MNNVRTFGVRRGPGTRIVEITDGAAADRLALGATLILGEFRSGPPLRLTEVDRGSLERVFGGEDPDLVAPGQALDFLEAADGAGRLFVVRTALPSPAGFEYGQGVSAQAWIYARDVSTDLDTRADLGLPSQIGDLYAVGSGIRCGGDLAVEVSVSNLSTAVSGESFALLAAGAAERHLSARNHWRGATLSISSYPGRTWRVYASDESAVYVVGGFPSDVAADTSAAVVRIVRESRNPVTGDREGYAVRWTDGGEAGERKFGARVTIDGGRALAALYEDVSLDSADPKVWTDEIPTVNALGVSNDARFVMLAPDASGVSSTDPLSRPANLADVAIPWNGIGVSSSDDRIEINTIRWTWSTATLSASGRPYVDVETATQPDHARTCRIECVFSSSTAFDVIVYEPGLGDGWEIGSGSIGTEFDGGSHYPSFTIVKPTGGTNPNAGDTITILSRPLPSDLVSRGAIVVFGASASSGVPSVRARIVERINATTFRYVKPPASLSFVPAAPYARGNVAGPFDLSAGSLTFKVDVALDGGTPTSITLTTTLSGASETLDDVIDDLNDLEATRAGGADLALVEFFEWNDSAGNGYLGVRTARRYGSGAALTVKNGTINTATGFGGEEDDEKTGSDGSILRLEWDQTLENGADASASTAQIAEFVGLLEEYVVPDLEGLPGTLEVYLAGVTDPGILTSIGRICYDLGFMANGEIAATLSKDQAKAWHEANIVPGGEAARALSFFYPSSLGVPNPFGPGLVTRPIVGAALGAIARKAEARKGYHVAGAGLDVEITKARRLPEILGTYGQTSAQYLEDVNAYGFRPIRVVGGRFFVYGDRIAADRGKLWHHKVKTVSHVSRVLLFALDAFHFEDPEATAADREEAILEVFEPWIRAGWFRRLGSGNDLEDYVEVSATGGVPGTGVAPATARYEVVDTSEVVEVSVFAGSLYVRTL